MVLLDSLSTFVVNMTSGNILKKSLFGFFWYVKFGFFIKSKNRVELCSLFSYSQTVQVVQDT